MTRVLPLTTLFFIAVCYSWLISPFFGGFKRSFRIQVRFWCGIILWLFGIKISQENKPDKLENPIIITANYRHSIDSIIWLATLPTEVIMTADAISFNLPIFGWGLRQASFIEIDRKVLSKLYCGLTTAENTLEQGRSVFIYLNAGPVKDNEPSKYLGGPVYLALKTGARLRPIVITGSEGVAGVSIFKFKKPKTIVNLNWLEEMEFSKMEIIRKEDISSHINCILHRMKTA